MTFSFFHLNFFKGSNPRHLSHCSRGLFSKLAVYELHSFTCPTGWQLSVYSHYNYKGFHYEHGLFFWSSRSVQMIN